MISTLFGTGLLLGLAWFVHRERQERGAIAASSGADAEPAARTPIA